MNPSASFRSLAALFGLALALGSAACTNPSAGDEDIAGTGDAITGTPSAATTPGWETLYAQAYAQDFTLGYCPPNRVSLLPAGRSTACDLIRGLAPGSSADVYVWKVKRNVTNAPREDVGTAWVVQDTSNGASHLYVFSDEEGRCLLSGEVVNDKVGWDAAPSCGNDS